MKIEIMDTTLRDGEQTPGLAYTDIEKLNLAQFLLEEVRVDRLEAASARVSKGELSAVEKVVSWGESNGYLDRIEILGFVDNGKSIDWIHSAGAKVLNLLCKGSLRHVTYQLKKTPKEHLSDVRREIAYAHQNDIGVNVYLETWSNGMQDFPDYVFQFMDALRNEGIMRFMLPDTLGILNPQQAYEYCKLMVERYPELKFDYHAHNDYDMAVANSFMAVKAGITGLHTTVNGLGERAGNTTLSSIVGALKDHCQGIEMRIDESKLHIISKIVETFSGIRIPNNKPIIGENVFTQTCGVHADGDEKADLYCNNLAPERFGRLRKYALGKTSGKASIIKNLRELGIHLDNESIARVTERVVELGDKKESITTEDLPFIVSDVLGTLATGNKVNLVNYYICHAQELSPVAMLKVEIDGKLYEETGTGDGQYDAFMRALSKVYRHLGRKLPELIDYIVTIPPGGKTNALVETVITWKNDKEFKTRGLDSDQTASAIKATLRMLNVIDKEY